MTAPAPWQCPACSAWIAPHVTEHRCDPPQGGVTVTTSPVIGGPFPLTFGSGSSTATIPGTITVNVTGGVASQQDLVNAVVRGLRSRAQSNWQTGFPARGQTA